MTDKLRRASLNEAFEINCVLTQLFTKSSLREAVQCNENNMKAVHDILQCKVHIIYQRNA